jgi:hypothetical protein
MNKYLDVWFINLIQKMLLVLLSKQAMIVFIAIV